MTLWLGPNSVTIGGHICTFFYIRDRIVVLIVRRYSIPIYLISILGFNGYKMSLFHNLKLKRRKIDLSHNNDGKLYCLLRYFKLSFYVLKGKKTQDFNFKLDLKAPKTACTKRKRLRLKQEDQQTKVLCL